MLENREKFKRKKDIFVYVFTKRWLPYVVEPPIVSGGASLLHLTYFETPRVCRGHWSRNSCWASIDYCPKVKPEISPIHIGLTDKQVLRILLSDNVWKRQITLFSATSEHEWKWVIQSFEISGFSIPRVRHAHWARITRTDHAWDAILFGRAGEL